MSITQRRKKEKEKENHSPNPKLHRNKKIKENIAKYVEDMEDTQQKNT